MSGRPVEADDDWTDSNGWNGFDSRRLSGPVACPGVGSVEVACLLKAGWVGRFVGVVGNGCSVCVPVRVICWNAVVALDVSRHHGCTGACLVPFPCHGERGRPPERLSRGRAFVRALGGPFRNGRAGLRAPQCRDRASVGCQPSSLIQFRRKTRTPTLRALLVQCAQCDGCTLQARWAGRS